jgi:hypothetical protein
MLARVGGRKTDLSRKLVDGAIPIAEDIDNLNSAPACHRLGNPSELVEELHFDRAIWHQMAVCQALTGLSCIQLIS